jgi:hypothetical protein
VEPLSGHLAHELYWVQPKALSRRYELRSDGEVVAALDFATAFGSLATANTAEGSWTFKRVGFFNPRVTIREAGKEENLGLYRPRWTGTEGELELAGGRVYRWHVANFWATRYEIRDAQGETQIEYRAGSREHSLADILKSQAVVTVSAAGQRRPEAGLLVLLGWYLVLLQQQDTAAIVAVTASV